MRIEEQFKKAYDEALWMVKFHKRSFWVVPLADGYGVSCFEPKNLAEGLKALEVKYEGQTFSSEKLQKQTHLCELLAKADELPNIGSQYALVKKALVIEFLSEELDKLCEV